MKTFRRPLWKTCTFKFGLLPGYLSLLVFGGYYLHDVEIPLGVWIYIIVICVIGFIGIIMRCFYIILTDDRLIVKNGLCPFWNEEFYFTDIKKAHMEQAGIIGISYIQVITKKKHNWKYILDFVGPKDYEELVPALKEKGINVETKNLTNLL